MLSTFTALMGSRLVHRFQSSRDLGKFFAPDNSIRRNISRRFNECVTVLPYIHQPSTPGFYSHYLHYLHHVETCTIHVHQCYLRTFVPSALSNFIWGFAVLSVAGSFYPTIQSDWVGTIHLLSIDTRTPRARSIGVSLEGHQYPLPSSLHSLYRASHILWPFWATPFEWHIRRVFPACDSSTAATTHNRSPIIHVERRSFSFFLDSRGIRHRQRRFVRVILRINYGSGSHPLCQSTACREAMCW